MVRPGPVALVGSGEYLPVMLEVEAALIAGRPARYVQLPTAAGEEGQASVARWIALGRQQAARLGVEAVPIAALDHTAADDPANAALVAGAGLIYLSGGSPAHLADSLRGSRLWAAIADAWQGGAALAGCSAGAMALTSWVPDLRHLTRPSHAGLGVVPRLRVIPHFDRMRRWLPGISHWAAVHLPDSVTLVGIEEDTAIVSEDADLARWVVRGRQRAWVLAPGRRRPLEAGEELAL
ncbi:MAG: Type 1 glutamine amidotransferase-like domain-containing protein [Candidatus Dormibacteria bacterium]